MKVIGIISCKGGVGKSTLAVNLSVLLSSFYFKKVGLLDADLYGPNHPQLFGLKNNSYINKVGKFLLPKVKYGVKLMSFGFFLKENSSVLLRGPVLSNTLKYLYNNTKWGDLDVLIVDFPPGTGDIYLSMLRDIKFDGVFLVTMSQLVSFSDLKRSIAMLDKFDINILGILENKKFYKCYSCKSSNFIYGNLELFRSLKNNINCFDIYSIPVDSCISRASNIGTPFVFFNSNYNFISVLHKMCKKIL